MDDNKFIKKLIRQYAISNIKMFLVGLICGWMSLGAVIMIANLLF